MSDRGEASQESLNDAAGDTALLPHFTTEQPNESIVLYEGGLEAVGQLEGEGTVSLDWLPTPRVKFRIVGTTDRRMDFTSVPTQRLILEGRQTEATGTFTGSEIRGGPIFTQVLRGVFDPVILGQPEVVQHVLFHIPNVPWFAGESIHRDDATGSHSWTGRLQFDDGIWEVTLDPLQNHRELVQQLNTTGGYALTAVGQIRRLNSGAFSMDETRDLLASLRLFLSLIAGRWTDSMLRVALSPDDRLVCEEWHSPMVDPWIGRRSVFPDLVQDENRLRSPRVHRVFRTLRTHWSDEAWRDVTTWAISWLIESEKSVNADTSIVLSQAGLELLAWTQLVLRDRISAREFKELDAHVALRKLLDGIGTPTGVPNGTMLDEMHTFASDEGVDAPEAFTRVRNAVVHPRAGGRRPSRELRIEASQLGLWYLQLAVLRLLDYDDMCLNRLRAWRPEPVPWA